MSKFKFQPVIKWSGSKRSQADKIISFFPKEIDTYYEPFVGGGSVMFQLLHSDIKVNNYICSDINENLINFWDYLKNDPDRLIDNYRERWNEINNLENVKERRSKYNEIRERYNQTKSVDDFYFLTRTCANGLIRYNSKGEFNSPYHHSRKGINPERLKKIVYDWSNKLNKYNVIFKHMSYEKIVSSKDDVLYLDPPYAKMKGIYYGQINYDEFWDWLEKQKGRYFLSFDGINSFQDNTYNVPSHLYNKHIYINNGISGFKKLHKQKEYVKESLYIK